MCNHGPGRRRHIGNRANHAVNLNMATLIDHRSIDHAVNRRVCTRLNYQITCHHSTQYKPTASDRTVA